MCVSLWAEEASCWGAGCPLAPPLAACIHALGMLKPRGQQSLHCPSPGFRCPLCPLTLWNREPRGNQRGPRLCLSCFQEAPSLLGQVSRGQRGCAAWGGPWAGPLLPLPLAGHLSSPTGPAAFSPLGSWSGYMSPPLARSPKPPAPSGARFISQDGGLQSYSEPTFQTQREDLEGMRGPHF